MSKGLPENDPGVQQDIPPCSVWECAMSFSSWIRVSCGGSFGSGNVTGNMLKQHHSLLSCLINPPVSFASKCLSFIWLLQATFWESQMAIRKAKIFSVFFSCESWPEHEVWQKHTHCLYKYSLVWTHPPSQSLGKWNQFCLLTSHSVTTPTGQYLPWARKHLWDPSS